MVALPRCLYEWGLVCERLLLRVTAQTDAGYGHGRLLTQAKYTCISHASRNIYLSRHM